MTEQRYIRITDHLEKEVQVYDTINEKKIFNIFFTELDSAICLNGALEDTVDLLNYFNDEKKELKKENEQLKSEIEKVTYANEDLLEQKRNWEKLSDEYAKLYDENEQLKKQLKKKVVEPIVNALKERNAPYGYYTDNKAGKEVRELFKSKPFNCADHWDGEH